MKVVLTLGVTAGTEELSDRLVSLRHLLETELTVANDNNTYPNTTINVRPRARTWHVQLSNNIRTFWPVSIGRYCLKEGF